MKINDKTRGRVCLAVIVIAATIASWFAYKVIFSGDQLYDHLGSICIAAAVAFALIVVGISVMWNHSTSKALAVTALIAATAATTTQAGLFTPAGGDSANSGKTGSYWSWLLHGWDFGWGFWRDGLDSWQSGHPVITIDPAPPSNNDASGQ